MAEEVAQGSVQEARGPARSFYGWRVLAASCVIMGYASGVVAYSATIFFKPVATALELSRTSMSLAIGLSQTENFILAPVVGYFIDRFGPRGLIYVGMTLTAVGLVLFGLFANSLPLFILTWTFMVASGANIGGFAPNWAAINNWFVRKKGQAMGFGMAAQSLGGVIMAPALAFLIARWDWRTAAVVAGVALALVVLPVARMVRTRPEEMGQRPDGDSPLPEGAASLGGAETSQKSGTSFRADVAHFTVRQAARTPALWFLILGMGLRQFGQSSLMLHLSPLLQDRGFDPVQAGAMVGLVASMGIVGAVVSGWVSDRFPRHRVMAIIVSVEVLAILSLVLADQTWQVYPFLLAYGFGLGAHALNRAILGEYFGQDHYAKIWGLISMTATPLAAAGPVYAGWVFDTTQSYAGALLTYVVAYAVAALFYLYCRRPRAPAPDAGHAVVP